MADRSKVNYVQKSIELDPETGKPKKKKTTAGSYSKPRRKGYEDMLKEASTVRGQ